MRFVPALMMTLMMSAAHAFQVPALTGPVMDETGTLSPAVLQKLSGLLQSTAQRGNVQLQVLVLSSLQGDVIEQASIKIVDQWKLGDAKKDNGVLFLIVPSERKMRIEVGQGLEGDLPDVVARRIIGDVVAPYFREGLYNEGITAGVIEILRHTDAGAIGEQTPARPVKKKISSLWIIIISLLIIFLKFFGGGGRGRGSRYRNAAWGAGGFGLGSGMGGGGWGGSSGGGGWGGGGGGFSGGGSSGSW